MFPRFKCDIQVTKPNRRVYVVIVSLNIEDIEVSTMSAATSRRYFMGGWTR